MTKTATLHAFVFASALLIAGVHANGQNQVPAAMNRAGAGASAGLTSAKIYHPSPDSWPVYSGDYSGRRYSPLKLINKETVGKVELAWTSDSLAQGSGEGVISGGDPRGITLPPSMGIVRGTPLVVDGVIYASAPGNVWAINARTGKLKWRYNWKYRGGTTIGNRGVGMWGEYLFVETPDNYLVSLDRNTGRERWHVEIEPFELQFFSTAAPTVIGDHVLTGTGSDHEQAGRLQSFDPVTGERQWVCWTTPLNPGDKGADTWKNAEAARHSGAQPWVPGSYDPETNLYIVGTSQPDPSEYYNISRDKDPTHPVNGDNQLYTSSMIGVDVETGKMKWHYQSSPGETHDFDSAQTPVLTDIMFRGKLRKVAVTAHRNGYFFVLDRTTGEHLLTTKLDRNANWAASVNANGQPIRNPEKDSTPDGVLVSPTNGGAANWPPPAFNPGTGLFYIPGNEDFAMYYAIEADPRGSFGLGGKDELTVPGGGNFLKAVDPTTGKVAWQIDYPTANPTGLSPSRGNGLLTTAGDLVFAATPEAGLVARDATNGKPLWHVDKITTDAPQTYMLDGKQYLLFGSGPNLYAYRLP